MFLLWNTRPKIEFTELEDITDKTNEDESENKVYEREESEEMRENEDELRDLMNRQQEQLRDYERKVN